MAENPWGQPRAFQNAERITHVHSTADLSGEPNPHKATTAGAAPLLLCHFKQMSLHQVQTGLLFIFSLNKNNKIKKKKQHISFWPW